MIVLEIRSIDPALHEHTGRSFVAALDPQANTLQIADNLDEAKLFVSEQEASDWWHNMVSQLPVPPPVMVRTFMPTLQ